MTHWPLPSRSFCLIRHGETTANADDIIAGVTDVPLTTRGRQQARDLSRRRWDSPIALFASPMSRAQDTCRLAFQGREFTLHEGLRERDWGVFEGRPLSEQPNRYATPQSGESWPAMLQRVHRAICDICAASPDALPVLVCHSGIIRSARVLWTTGKVGNRPPNAQPILFEAAGEHLKETEL